MNSEQSPVLNLPPAPLTIVRRNGHPCVFDILRRRYIKITPEEWVRQHFVHYLIHHKGYPQELLANEISLTLGATTKRCDTVLYDRQARPCMIIEYKAPHVLLSQRVFDQISRYNIAFHVDYLLVSNGLQHYCCRMDYTMNTYAFLTEIPDYGQL